MNKQSQEQFKLSVVEACLAQVKLADDKYDAIKILESWAKAIKEDAHE